MLYASDQNNDTEHELSEHENKDYPVGVYYVDSRKMYMGYVRLHWHEEIELNLVKEGTAEFHIGEQIVRLEKGQAIFLNENTAHSIYPIDNGSFIMLSLVFHPSFLFPAKGPSVSNFLYPLTRDSDTRYACFSTHDPYERGIINYLNDILSTNLSKDYGYELLTKGYLCELWLQLIKKYAAPVTGPKPQQKVPVSLSEIRIKDALTYIHEHYAEPILLDDIAESIHVSKSECCRCFKKAVYMTPFEYLMKYRILMSADKILHSDSICASISELAASVGFNNTSYYNKLFKKYIGCTPTKYRNESKTEHRDTLSPFGLSLFHF